MPAPLRPLLAATSVAALALLAACAAEPPVSVDAARTGAPAANRAGHDSAGMHRQYGAPVKVGNGMARAYVVLNAKSGQAPVELGVALDAGALEGLPSHGEHQSITLRLPARSPAPYRLVELNWNPHGHPPMDVYTSPHFDFHFYRTTLAARDAIVPSDRQFEVKARNLPMGEHVPAGYVVPGDAAEQAVPQMGVHWFDRTAPELQKLFQNPGAHQAFTKTFIYGSWNGEITFYEPMITRAYLLTKPDVETPIGIPVRYPEPGWYPTAYRVAYDAQAREYRVALTRLVERP